MKIRHPNRPNKHGHNPKACGVCQPNKKFARRWKDREREERRLLVEA